MGAIQQALLMPIFTAGVTYSTLNPADKGAGVTLSSGDLVGTITSSATVRSTLGKSTGKWYWEYQMISSTDVSIGIATSSATLTNYLGADIGGFGYIPSTGQKANNGGFIAYGGTYTTTDVIGVALDVDADTVTFYKNNVSQGTAYTGLSGTYFAAMGGTNAGASVRFNFGATALTYAPPSGFNAGLYI